MITLDLQHASTSYSIIHILKLPLPSTARSLDLLSLFTYLPTLARRRQWHPTPVLLPGKSHGRRSLEGCSRWGHWGSDTTERLYFHFSLSCIGEGNGNPLQCSCLGNPRDGGAWWAAVYGVSQSWTQLKRLSSSSKGDPRELSLLIEDTMWKPRRGPPYLNPTRLATLSLTFSHKNWSEIHFHCL